MAGFVGLIWAVDGVLAALPDEVEAALKGGFYLSNRVLNRVVDRFGQLGDLVDAEKCVGVEDERNDDLAGSKHVAFEGCIAGVGGDVAAVDTPDPRTIIPGLDGGFTALRTESLFLRLLTEPLNQEIEQLWAQHY